MTDAPARRQIVITDLVIIAVSASLLRFVFYPVYRAYFAFPWDQAVYAAFLSTCYVATLRVIPKPGVTLLWTAAWALLDYWFQNGAPAYLLGYLPIPIVTELALWVLGRGGQDLASALLGAVVYQAGHSTWTWIAYNEIWLIPPYPLTTFATVGPVATLMAAPLGTAAGYLLSGAMLAALRPRPPRPVSS